jgi:uracil-DNA glycosylase family 4
MSGFFSIKETTSIHNPRNSCVSCGLYKNATNPKLVPSGNFKKGIMNIIGAPSKLDDQKGTSFNGRVGSVLKTAYKELGIDLFEDCLNVNAIRCYTDKEINNNYLDCCKSSLIKLIKEKQPKVIILLGDQALYNIIGYRWKGNLGGINKWRGFTIPDQFYKSWVCPVFDVDYVDHSEKEVTTIWKQDLANALSKVNEILPKYIEPKITFLKDLSLLSELKTDLIAFDYETTGLKPHKEEQKIICCSIATSENQVFVFMMPENNIENLPFRKLLKNSEIGKMAHNIKFEDTWTKVKLKTTISNWNWDSMLAAHIFDNRTEITGLKFQSYVNFGIDDYSSEITPYLKSTDGTSNGMNKVLELIKTKEGKNKLLTYCAMDSILEYRLAIKQMKIMKYDFLPF